MNFIILTCDIHPAELPHFTTTIIIITNNRHHV